MGSGCCTSIEKKYKGIVDEILRTYSKKKVEKANILAHKEMNKSGRLSQYSIDHGSKSPPGSLSNVECMEIHLTNQRRTLFEYLSLRRVKIKPVGGYIKSKIFRPDTKIDTKLLAILLFNNLIQIELPGASTKNMGNVQILNECEDYLLASLVHLTQINLNLNNEDITFSVLSTLRSYTNLKTDMPHFSKLSTLFEYVQQNMKNTIIEVRHLSQEILFNMIVLMDSFSLNKKKHDILTVTFDLLCEEYKKKKEGKDIGDIDENNNIQAPNDSSSSAKSPQNSQKVLGEQHLDMKSLCIDTIAHLTQKIASPSSDNPLTFLRFIFDYFNTTKWEFDEMAGDLFDCIIAKCARNDQKVRMEVMCNMSIVQMFEEMGNFIQLEEPDIEIQERVIVKKRILGVLKQMLTSCDSESIGNLCLEGYTKGFIYLIQIAAQTDDLEFIDMMTDTIELFIGRFSHSSYIKHIIKHLLQETKTQIMKDNYDNVEMKNNHVELLAQIIIILLKKINIRKQRQDQIEETIFYLILEMVNLQEYNILILEIFRQLLQCEGLTLNLESEKYIQIDHKLRLDLLSTIFRRFVSIANESNIPFENMSSQFFEQEDTLQKEMFREIELLIILFTMIVSNSTQERNFLYLCLSFLFSFQSSFYEKKHEEIQVEFPILALSITITHQLLLIITKLFNLEMVKNWMKRRCMKYFPETKIITGQEERENSKNDLEIKISSSSQLREITNSLCEYSAQLELFIAQRRIFFSKKGLIRCGIEKVEESILKDKLEYSFKEACSEVYQRKQSDGPNTLDEEGELRSLFEESNMNSLLESNASIISSNIRERFPEQSIESLSQIDIGSLQSGRSNHFIIPQSEEASLYLGTLKTILKSSPDSIYSDNSDIFTDEISACVIDTGTPRANIPNLAIGPNAHMNNIRVSTQGSASSSNVLYIYILFIYLDINRKSENT